MERDLPSNAARAGRFTYSVVASALHDPDVVAALTGPIRAVLDDLGGHPGAVDEDGRHPHLFVMATGGTERAVLELVRRRNRTAPMEPNVLVAHGDHNSLPAALEALAALRQANGRGRIVYLAGDASDHDALDRAVVDLEVVHGFRTARLGLIGGPSDWLVASSPSAEVVRRRWGPQIEVIEPERMLALAGRASAPAIERVASRFAAPGGPSDPSVSAESVTAAATMGAALEEIAAGGGFPAIAVRCFDLLGAAGTSGCLGLAAMNDAGVVAGCEGDVPSTLAMLWIRLLLEQPSWIANPARVDADHNRVVLAHCTIAPSMTTGFTLSTHFESGIGVGIRGRMAPQPVTLVRIGGRELEEVWIAQGHITAGGDDPRLCRTQVTIELDDRSVGDLLARPLGNHLVLAAGHHGERLNAWWDFAIAP